MLCLAHPHSGCTQLSLGRLNNTDSRLIAPLAGKEKARKQEDTTVFIPTVLSSEPPEGLPLELLAGDLVHIEGGRSFKHRTRLAWDRPWSAVWRRWDSPAKRQ